METKSLTVSFLVNETPQEVFNAVNNVTGWWTENLKGKSKELNDEFEVQFGDVHYSKQKLVTVEPNQKVVWLVTDSRLNFIKDKTEWTNTKIVFEIFKEGNKTGLRFTHEGLVPQIECFSACSGAWTDYIINSLEPLIETGKGNPTKKEKAINKA
ncbi:MAG: SRPBCC domain-containing protein [Chitinophagaceae bacterium]